MRVLQTTALRALPLQWANLDSYRDSKGSRIEVYLPEVDDPTVRQTVDGLVSMFHTLFGGLEDNIKVYDRSWWNYCLDTWDFANDKHVYDSVDMSAETQDYLALPKKSAIDIVYAGVCRCTDWNTFLAISLACVVTHGAPYSHIYFNEQNDFFFYFHHTGSIGLYYRERNQVIDDILGVASRLYDVRN